MTSRKMQRQEIRGDSSKRESERKRRGDLFIEEETKADTLTPATSKQQHVQHCAPSPLSLGKSHIHRTS